MLGKNLKMTTFTHTEKYGMTSLQIILRKPVHTTVPPMRKYRWHKKNLKMGSLD